MLLKNNFVDRFGTCNPFAIAEELGIEIRFVMFLEHPLGYFTYIDDEPIILLSKELENDYFKYFVSGHEVAHYLKHNDQYAYYMTGNRQRDKFEAQSNRAAFEMLKGLYEELEGEPPRTFNDVQRKFNIPDKFIEFV